MCERLADQSFYKTSETERILKAAEAIIHWAKSPYTEHFIQLSKNILADIQCCFASKKSIQAEREHLCTQYHALQTSPTFADSWATFLQQSTRANSVPTFCQHVTQNIFTNLVK